MSKAIPQAELPDVHMPLPERTLVKWSRWRSWVDEQTGEAFVKYSCRHTAEPIPERFGALPNHTSNRSFLCVATLVQYDNETPIEGEVWTVNYITHGAMVPVERLDELVAAVRSGAIMHKPEGTAPALLPVNNDAA